MSVRRLFRAHWWLQVLLLVALWWIVDLLVRLTGFLIPSPVVALFLLLGLLATKRLRLGSVRRGARWFLAEMLLFFIPAVLAVVDHPNLWGLTGLKILVVITVGILVVMLVTATVVELCVRLLGNRGARHAD
jgi:holin-like protein